MAEGKAIAVLYICVFAFLSILFLAILYGPIVSAFPETDLWWMIPTLFHYVDGKSFSDVFSFLISPSPIGFGQPALKIYLFLILSVFGLQTKHLIFASIGVHFVNSGLLFLLSKKLGLDNRISFFSALTYLTIFAHFHSYMWPTAAQHVLAMFFILLVLNLYMTVDRLIKDNKPYRWYFVLTLAVSVSASFQRGTIIAPVLMLLHILVCSDENSERVKKYGLWLPLFIAYLIYPSAALTFVGDVILTTFIAEIPVSPILKFLLVFLGGVLCLVFIKVSLWTYPRYKQREILRWLSIMMVPGILLLLYLKDVRNLLLPYHVMIPFISLLTAFLEPLQQVFAIDSTEAHHVITPRISVFSFLLGLLVSGVFIKVFLLKKKQLVMLGAWYISTLAHLLFQYSSHPVRTPSRYYIYLSPLLSIIFCSVVIYAYTHVTSKIQLRSVTKEVCLALIFIALFIPNILAIKVEMFRGKLVNTYFIYDYVRTAELIKSDVIRSANGAPVSGRTIYVSNVVEMPFKELWAKFSPVDPYRYDNFRFVVREAFNNKSSPDIRVNEPAVATPGNSIYVIRDDQITNTRGKSIDPFSQLFVEAVSLMRVGRNQEASELFNEAIKRRPFLVNYVLGSHRLEDLRWVTNGVPMRVWINKVADNVKWGDRTKKRQYISTVMNNELSDYVLCLFYISYLKHVSGKVEESRFWLSQIQYLESDSAALSSWMNNVPVIRDDKEMLAFVHKFDDSSYFRDPLPWRKDDYGFERFVFRLIFGLELMRPKREVSVARDLRGNQSQVVFMLRRAVRAAGTS